MVPSFPWSGGPLTSQDIVVTASIVVHEKHDYKLLTVIGPRRSTTQQFFRAVEVGLSSMSHYWVSQFSNSVKRDFRVSSFDRNHNAAAVSSTFETGNQTYKTEVAAYYYFYKILSNQSYSVGIELSRFISEFNSHFVFPSSSKLHDFTPRSSVASLCADSSENSLEVGSCTLPAWSPKQSMSRVADQISKTISQFDTNYTSLRNPATALSDDLLPRLRPSVERYVFESVGESVWVHYRHFFSDLDKAFHVKANAIRLASDGSSVPLIESCSVRECMRFDFSKSTNLMNELQRIFDREFNSPNLLLQKVLSILISIKTDVLQGSNGQRELESMDDIAPIFLYTTVSASELVSPNAIYNYLLDFMTSEQRMESEGRSVALLEGATRLIMNDWTHTTLQPATPQHATPQKAPNIALLD